LEATKQRFRLPLDRTNITHCICHCSIQNHVRRAHHNALTLIGFLAIPKSTLIASYHSDFDHGF